MELITRITTPTNSFEWIENKKGSDDVDGLEDELENDDDTEDDEEDDFATDDEEDDDDEDDSEV